MRIYQRKNSLKLGANGCRRTAQVCCEDFGIGCFDFNACF